MHVCKPSCGVEGIRTGEPLGLQGSVPCLMGTRRRAIEQDTSCTSVDVHTLRHMHGGEKLVNYYSRSVQRKKQQGNAAKWNPNPRQRVVYTHW